MTIKDISAEAQVSLRTVSLVLNNTGRISQATRERVLEIAQRMNYQPNFLAKGLVNNRTYLFGVNLPYLDFSFINTVISGMEQKCIELHYELLLASTYVSDISFLDNDIPSIKNSLNRLMHRHVDGIVCFPDIRVVELYMEVLEQGLPLIQLLRRIPDLPCPSITVDNEKGMYLATKYLLDTGHRCIGFLNYWDLRFEEIKDRFKGYIRAYEESGFPMERDVYSIPCELDFKGGYEAASTLLKRIPKLDAIVAATDYAAAGALRACVDRGKRIPEEISIIGYDDMEFTELQGYKTLSTVRQPKHQIGILAVELLYRMINGEVVSSVVLEPELILRESSGGIRS